MQSITITGNLGGDVEEKQVNGQTVREISVAATSKIKGEKVTTWYRVTLWGDFYKAVSEYLVRGTKVLVVGDYTFRTWEGNGKSGVSHDIRCDKLELLGSKPEGEKQEKPRDTERPKGKTGNPFLDDD